jgi:hypothetical protein
LGGVRGPRLEAEQTENRRHGDAGADRGEVDGWSIRATGLTVAEALSPIKPGARKVPCHGDAVLRFSVPPTGVVGAGAVGCGDGTQAAPTHSS